MPGAHKIGAAISGPRIAGGNFITLKAAFSEFGARGKGRDNDIFRAVFPSMWAS